MHTIFNTPSSNLKVSFPSAARMKQSTPIDVATPLDAFTRMPTLRFGRRHYDKAHTPTGEFVLSPATTGALDVLHELSTSIITVPEVKPMRTLNYRLKNDGFFADQSVTNELNTMLRSVDSQHTAQLQSFMRQNALEQYAGKMPLDALRVQRPLSREATRLLVQQKYNVSRFYDSCVPEYKSPGLRQTAKDTQGFLRELQSQYVSSVDVFRQGQFGEDVINSMPPEYLEVYRTIVAMTAPLIFNMGFRDGIPHAGQVSRLAANQMRRFYREYPADMIDDRNQLLTVDPNDVNALNNLKNNSITSDIKDYQAALKEWIAAGRDPATLPKRHTTELQMLQAAIVGWLHDCKLEWLASKENLASHPLVSSAVAWSVSWKILHDNNIQRLLRDKLGLDADQRDDFIQEIVEAISLNNDSAYVLDNAILGKEGGYGIINRMIEANSKQPGRFSQQAMEHLALWAKQRFKATSESCSIDPDSERTKPWSLEKYCENTPGVTTQVQEQIKDALDHLTIKTGLFDRDNNDICVPVKYLFSHHEDVSPSARILALCLQFADNLLLSPQKTVPVNPHEPIRKIDRYLTSLDENFETLPIDINQFQQPFYRAILLSMLKSSDAYRQYLANYGLFGRKYDDVSVEPLYSEFIKRSEITPKTYDQVRADNASLLKTLRLPSTWGETWSKSNVNISKDKPFNQLISQFDKDYRKMTAAYADVAMANVDEQRFKFAVPD